MNNTSTYLWPRNRSDGKRHLAIWANDLGNSHHGRFVALCGGQRGNRWPITFDGADTWPLACQAPICGRCLEKLSELKWAAR